MNKKENELFAQLRSILNGKASGVAWIQILSALRSWRDPDTFENVALPYVASYTDRWPEEIPRAVSTESLQFPAKRIPVKELFAAAPGIPILRIANKIRITGAKMGALDMGHRILESPHADRIRALELVSTDMDARHLPPLLDLPNLRRVMIAQTSFQGRANMSLHAKDYEVLGRGVEHLVADTGALASGVLGGDTMERMGVLANGTRVFPDLRKLTTMGTLSCLVHGRRDEPVAWNKVRAYEYEMFGSSIDTYDQALQGVQWSSEFTKRLPELSDLVVPHPGNSYESLYFSNMQSVITGKGTLLERVVFRKRTIPEGAHFLRNSRSTGIDELRSWLMYLADFSEWQGAKTVEFWTGRQYELFETIKRLDLKWPAMNKLVLRLRGDSTVNEECLPAMAQAFKNRNAFVNLNDLYVHWDAPLERAQQDIDVFERVLADRHVLVHYGERDQVGVDKAKSVLDTLVL